MKRVLLSSCVVLCALFFGGAFVHAQENYAGQERMNGYALRDFGDFTKWHLVTVRYRQDTGEMRYTYANDIAWDALLKGGTRDYPDGAVFGKVGIMTEEDPAFPSSLVPSGAVRYQLMVMDHAKNTETDGWGYAIFGKDGLTFDEDPVAKTQACHACHLLVPDRGYVFSKPMPLAMPENLRQFQQDEASALGNRLTYITVDTATLNERVRKAVPQKYKQVRLLEGDLRKHLFSGTLNEIRPALIKEMRDAQLPVLLLSEDNTKFSLVYPDVTGKKCKDKSGVEGVKVMGAFSAGKNLAEVLPYEGCVPAK